MNNPEARTIETPGNGRFLIIKPYDRPRETTCPAQRKLWTGIGAMRRLHTNLELSEQHTIGGYDVGTGRADIRERTRIVLPYPRQIQRSGFMRYGRALWRELSEIRSRGDENVGIVHESHTAQSVCYCASPRVDEKSRNVSAPRAGKSSQFERHPTCEPDIRNVPNCIRQHLWQE